MPPSRAKPVAPLSRKPTRKESEAFSVAHQNVLLERMENNIQAIADGHVFLRERMDGFDKRFDQVDQRFDRIEQRMGGIEADVKELKLGQARVEGIVIEILGRLKFLEERVAALEARLRIPPADAADSHDTAEKLRRLEERVALIEARVA